MDLRQRLRDLLSRRRRPDLLRAAELLRRQDRATGGHLQLLLDRRPHGDVREGWRLDDVAVGRDALTVRLGDGAQVLEMHGVVVEEVTEDGLSLRVARLRWTSAPYVRGGVDRERAVVREVEGVRVGFAVSPA